MKLYLASKSPRRKELMRFIAADFTLLSSNFDESTVPLSLPEEYVMALAAGKAEHAALSPKADEVIIGCDTVVVSPDGEIFGKPKDEKDARRMLKSLSDRTHRVLTGVCLLSQEKEQTFYEETKVTFYPLDDAMIDFYLSCGEYADKAGAYGIQGKGCLLCRKIDGDYYNVVGLPAARLFYALKDFSARENM